MEESKIILVVDDTRQIRKVLQFSLVKVGYDVKLAENGIEALRYMSDHSPPNLIILDIMMPGMDGYEVIRRIRENSNWRNVPILFLTAKAQRDDVIKGIDLGANDYMVKPYKLWDLHKKIEKLLN